MSKRRIPATRYPADKQVPEENIVNDTQIGFLLMFGAVQAISINSGFRRARGDKPWTLRPRSLVMYAISAYVWNMGVIAIYPSFMSGEGRNAYIAYPFLMAMLSCIATLVCSFLWGFFFKGLNWAAKKYNAVMAVY